MNWANWSDFFAMGGHALYVWGSLLVIFCLMAAELTLLAVRWQVILRHLGRWQRSGVPLVDESNA